MTDKTFHVVCTGRGEHGRIGWPSLTLGDDGAIREDRTRQAPSPLRGIVEGTNTPLYRKAVVPVEQHRSELGTWRWQCPTCHLDRPLVEDHLRAWMKVSIGGVLDISTLPR
jgi:hypothetical protein